MNKVFNIFRLICSKDPRLRLELLVKLGRIILPGYRFKWPQMAWWTDPIFNKYLVQFDEIGGLNTDRRWMLYQLIRLARNVPGDTAECGVYRGAGSYLICKVNQENKQHHRVHHIFDSFEGLSKPSELDGKYWAEGDMTCPLETVNENLSEFNNISIHKGWIPELFSNVDSNRFCFVHIDVDLHQPTLASFEFFYPRMNEGAVILCDDYGFTSCPGATDALDQFLQDKKEKMISLSGGGGFLIKGTETSNPLTSH
ncbi:MAG: TylF/MycF/NovP-related O-methyltransferase [Waddliaceae bacterium]